MVTENMVVILTCWSSPGGVNISMVVEIEKFIKCVEKFIKWERE